MFRPEDLKENTNKFICLIHDQPATLNSMLCVPKQLLLVSKKKKKFLKIACDIDYILRGSMYGDMSKTDARAWGISICNAYLQIGFGRSGSPRRPIALLGLYVSPVACAEEDWDGGEEQRKKWRTEANREKGDRCWRCFQGERGRERFLKEKRAWKINGAYIYVLVALLRRKHHIFLGDANLSLRRFYGCAQGTSNYCSSKWHKSNIKRKRKEKEENICTNLRWKSISYDLDMQYLGYI